MNVHRREGHRSERRLRATRLPARNWVQIEHWATPVADKLQAGDRSRSLEAQPAPLGEATS